MTLVQVLVPGGDAELVDAQLAFHLNAGVDFVLALGSPGAAADAVLEAYERGGHLRRLAPGGDRDEAAQRRDAIGVAAREHGADWVLVAAPGEFWWPRAESFGDVLVSIPERYGIVQGLVRDFVSLPAGDGDSPLERLTVRERVADGSGERRPPASRLRPLFRVTASSDLRDAQLDEILVPLRAWYPLEVLRFPLDDQPLDEVDVDRRLGTGELVHDARLRDVMRALRAPAEHAGPGAYLLPPGAPTGLLTAPSIVDDAEYAAECAEVGEVDLVGLERQIRELHERLAALEHPLWPRVRRRLVRLLRR